MRLIDADKLEPIEVGIDEMSFLAVDYEDIKKAPTIDIVRCEECKHRDEDECKWDTTRSTPNDDDFCSLGERSE